MRTISLPAIDRKVSLLDYVAAIRVAKANPTGDKILLDEVPGRAVKQSR